MNTTRINRLLGRALELLLSILMLLAGQRIAGAAPTPAPTAVPSVAAWPVEVDDCLALLRHDGNPLVTQAVSALLGKTPAASWSRLSPSLMVVAYRWRHAQVRDLVVQMFTDPLGGDPAMLNPHGVVQAGLGNELYDSADHLLGLLYNQVNYAGDVRVVQCDQRAFAAGVQGDLTLLREQTVEPLQLLIVLPHSGAYLPRSLRSRVRGLVLSGELTFGQWHGDLNLITADDQAAEQVGNILAAWRELAVSLVDEFASYGIGQTLRAALKDSVVRVKANRVLASASIPAATVVRIAKEMAGHAPPRKVLICHKGHTISVSEDAVPAHLAHGDTLGPCPGQTEPGASLSTNGPGWGAAARTPGNPPFPDGDEPVPDHRSAS